MASTLKKKKKKNGGAVTSAEKPKKKKKVSKPLVANSDLDDDDELDESAWTLPSAKTKKVRSTPDNTGLESVSMSEFARIRSGIQRHPRVRDLLDVRKTVKISSQLHEELRGMFVTSRDQKLGTFSYNGVDPQFKNPRKNAIAIAETILKIQALRDRALGIQLPLYTFLTNIVRARRVIKEIIYECFGTELKKLGALPVQSALFDAVLEPLTEKRDEVEMLLSISDKILKNLDNSHFSYREAGARGDSVISRAEGAYAGRN